MLSDDPHLAIGSRVLHPNVGRCFGRSAEEFRPFTDLFVSRYRRGCAARSCFATGARNAPPHSPMQAVRFG